LVEHDVVAAADVGPLHDVGVVDLVVGTLVDALVPDPIGGVLFELVKGNLMFLGRRVQGNGHGYQPETDHSGPN
jgi:hypothetical protein